MNINRINQVMETYQGTVRKPVANTKKTSAARDEINISSEAKLYDIAKKAAGQLPDVREDKVQAILKKLDNGTYNIPAAAVAGKLLD